jgi:hypothetical protein
MNDHLLRVLSWSATVLCVVYTLWACYHFQGQMPLMAQYLTGLGVELPISTRMVLAAAAYIWPLGVLLVVLLFGKEMLIRNAVLRLAITFLIFFSTLGFLHFAVTALREPMDEILRKVG